MKKFFVLLPILALVACSSSQDDEEESELYGEESIMDFKGASLAPSTPAGNLIDHGGKVLPASRTYAIWWGSSTAWQPDTQSGITNLLVGMNGSTFVGLDTQYMRGGSTSTFFSGMWTDSSSPPRNAPTVSTLVKKVCSTIVSYGLSADPQGIYFVYTSNFPRGTNFCAWHSWGTCNGTTIQVAYMPNTTGIGGCDPGNSLGCNTYSQGTRSLANVTSHEMMEAITDPTLSAWYDSAGAENADKCAWSFSSCVTLSTGNWQLQQEWSNAANGCLQQ